jgi:hypothetical protein
MTRRKDRYQPRAASATLYRLAASYVDRILKGEKPADLPVHAPTKYETGSTSRLPKHSALEVPPSVFARADGSSNEGILLRCMSPLVALSGPAEIARECLLSGVKPTCVSNITEYPLLTHNGLRPNRLVRSLFRATCIRIRTASYSVMTWTLAPTARVETRLRFLYAGIPLARK